MKPKLWKVIARRLSESASTVPVFYVSMDIEIDAMVALLAQLNAKAPPKDAPGAYVITINDMVIKALALTAQKVPEINRAYLRTPAGDRVVDFDHISVNLPVAL